MNQSSKELFERSKAVSPGGVHSPVRAFKGVGGTPPFIESANQVFLKDVDGKEYLDFCMSWGPLILGHRDPDVEKEVSTAIRKGWSFGTTEPYSLKLAEFITTEIPWVEKIRFVNSGTEAVMSAVRLARAATQRTKILKFDGCYHGHVDSMLVRAGSGLAEMAEPDSLGIPQNQETLIAPLDDLEAVEKIYDQYGKDIAATIIEPLPANNGLLVQKPGYLQSLRDITRRHESLLIFDEVISGFRMGFGGMAEREGVTPDLVTYGKIIGGGFPVGAYGGRKDLLAQVAPEGRVYQAGTLSANPVSMVAGLTTLEKLKYSSPYQQLRSLAEYFQENLPKSSPIQLQSFESLFWIVLSDDSTPIRSVGEISSESTKRFSDFFHHCLQYGIYLAPSAYEVGFLSTCHTTSHLEKLIGAIKAYQ